MNGLRWTHIVVHHTGAEEKDAEQVRRYHLSLGWRDIGYHYVIERDGRVVAGRGLDQPGAHCRAAGMNTRGIGLALLGNLSQHPPFPQQQKALEALLKELMQRFGIPPENILGHREVRGAATDCPGGFMDMGKLRGAVAKGGGGAERVYRVQAGAFSERENAEALASRLRAAGFEAIVVSGEG